MRAALPAALAFAAGLAAAAPAAATPLGLDAAFLPAVQIADVLVDFDAGGIAPSLLILGEVSGSEPALGATDMSIEFQPGDAVGEFHLFADLDVLVFGALDLFDRDGGLLEFLFTPTDDETGLFANGILVRIFENPADPFPADLFVASFTTFDASGFVGAPASAETVIPVPPAAALLLLGAVALAAAGGRRSRPAA